MANAPTLSLIVAMAENRVIGRDGALPWRLPGDLRRFKALTTGHTVVMGRKTFDSIARPLPHRRNIVVTRNPAWSAPGVEVAHGLDDAIAMAAEDGEVFVIGGEALYRAALPRAQRIYLTRVHARPEGDTHFPAFEGPRWTLRVSESHEAAPEETADYAFQLYERSD